MFTAYFYFLISFLCLFVLGLIEFVGTHYCPCGTPFKVVGDVWVRVWSSYPFGSDTIRWSLNGVDHLGFFGKCLKFLYLCIFHNWRVGRREFSFQNLLDIKDMVDKYERDYKRGIRGKRR